MQLGPTPLKDGQILSLFDTVSSVTPSKSRAVLSNIEGNIAATPSRNNRSRTSIAESPAAENVRGSRTPASSGKRFMLDSFATPLKRKREDENQGHATPSSSMKLLATPAFLQRSNTLSIMESLAEEAEQDGEMIGLTRSRGPQFKKNKGFIRSLSSIIQGMRKQEDDMLDDELDIMREMEGAEQVPKTKPTAVRKDSQSADRPSDTLPGPEVLVEDSQAAMPLGPDRAFESEESDDDNQDNGQQRKPYKKKGLKRQTKRVMMRPVTHRAPKAATTQNQPIPEVEQDREVVADTQLAIATIPEDFDDESDYSDTEAKLQRSEAKAAQLSAGNAVASSTNDTEGVLKKTGRKISALAHTNFRRLKIRNQNSKAGGGRRFGRR